MKLTTIVYIVDGPMGIKHRFSVVATEGGLEKANNYTKDNKIESITTSEVKTFKEYTGSSQNRFQTCFMDGAKTEEVVKHYSTGSQFAVVYS